MKVSQIIEQEFADGLINEKERDLINHYWKSVADDLNSGKYSCVVIPHIGNLEMNEYKLYSKLTSLIMLIRRSRNQVLTDKWKAEFKTLWATKQILSGYLDTTKKGDYKRRTYTRDKKRPEW